MCNRSDETQNTRRRSRLNNLCCPGCGLSHSKKHGHTHYGKQNYRCRDGGRQFVADSQRIANDKRLLIRKLRLERLSLRGICRSLEISLPWLVGFIAEVYDDLPDDLYSRAASPERRIHLLRLEAEADEWWSFVGKKRHKPWVWIAFEPLSREVLAFSVGDRSRHSAGELWRRIAAAYRQRATFYSDDWQACKEVIPGYQHEVCAKASGRTKAVERFTCSLRQRLSRLVRDALSFSKKLANHIGAIK